MKPQKTQGKVVRKPWGEGQLTESPTVTVLRQILVALESAALLVDMQPRVIRNHTDYPFIFSDSPVVFYNSYYRNITDRGVLGLQTPGLQIFLPLTPKLQLMMFDPNVYTGPCLNGPFCEAINRPDVSHLNALQLHHSSQAVYFADPDDFNYVEELYKAHRSHFIKPQAEFRIRQDVLVRGEPSDGDILHTFEPQVNHNLSLSFVSCSPVSPRDFKFSCRSPEVVDEYRRLHPTRRRNQGTQPTDK